MDTKKMAAGAVSSLRQLSEYLEQHVGFSEVLSSLTAGHSGTLGGVWGSSRALVAATLSKSAPGLLVLVCPHPGDVDRVANDLAVFTHTKVARFPAWESEPGEQVIHDEIYGHRLYVLKTLAGYGDVRLENNPPETSQDSLTAEKNRTPSASLPHGSHGDTPEEPDFSTAGPLHENPESGFEILVTSIQSLLQPVPTRDRLAEATRILTSGSRLNEEELGKWLLKHGCHSTSAVELPGEFSVRGGIMDIFPPDALNPVRVELFGDEIESLRRFDVTTQRSLGEIDSVALTMLAPTRSDRAHFASYLADETWFMLLEPNQLQEEGKYYLERLERPQDFHAVRTTLAEIYKYPSVTAAGIPSGSLETTCHLEFESVERFSGDINKVRDELEAASVGNQVYVVCETEAEIERLTTVFEKTSLIAENRLTFVLGHLEAGFRLVALETVIVSAAELFQRHDLARTNRRHQRGRVIDSFLQLREGDLVVHLTHGIGRYRGLKLLQKKDGLEEEHLELEFHGGTKIYVPSSKIELVQKYVGGTKTTPTLARIGGKAWIRQKEAAEQAVTDLASDMIDTQAQRDARAGIPFPADSLWQREFDAAFPYQETPDQITAIQSIKDDMMKTRPMDRLLCGDVGFGKTEVAIRAAFKAVDAGFQVAILVPTTVLAVQHLRTFKSRMAEFPFKIACISRFSTAKEQRKALKQTAAGEIDILIGTHRIASSNVHFSNLGLVIIDEEQRFGVAVKERLKALRAAVDVLTMTATPIPRTLHMSLLGIRAISNLETPPPDRIAIETRVTRFNETLIRHAVMRELNRNGQIFFVHNRIQDIKRVQANLQKLIPEARIEVGHGQMKEGELEHVMMRFINHDFDVLIATTIVESGLDIPNANTIFIDEADRYGLSDLHQLRGRVGRYKHRAYCYLLINEGKHLSPVAAKRLRAIEEFSQMGAGFALSMRDLELRGAGNIIGTQQSGHIATVGYELYCAMLEKAVRRLKNLAPRESVDVTLDLEGATYFPRTYITDQRTKIDLYRRMSRMITEEQINDFGEELVDRFGTHPTEVASMLELARLRVWCHGWGIRSIHLEGRYVVLGYTSPKQLALLVARSRNKLRIADGQSAYLPLAKELADQHDKILLEIKSLLQPY